MKLYFEIFWLGRQPSLSDGSLCVSVWFVQSPALLLSVADDQTLVLGHMS